MFCFRKSAAVFVFVRSPTVLFVCVLHNQSGYLALRTTKVEDRKLTLAVTYFILSRIKQLFKYFKITNIREKSCRVSVPVKEYNSLITCISSDVVVN